MFSNPIVSGSNTWVQDSIIPSADLYEYIPLISTDDTTLMAASEEELKSLLMKVKEESEKADLELNIQKCKIMVSGPITSQLMCAVLSHFSRFQLCVTP